MPVSAFESPFGTFRIERYGAPDNRTLRAWNSADVLLLEQVSQQATEAEQILTVNDAFGALSIPVGGAMSWTDSAVARDAIAHNAQRNGQTPPLVVSSTSTPALADSDIQTVLMQIPKQRAFFEEQLRLIASIAHADLRLFCAGMDKHLFPGTGDLIESYIGPTERHRGKRKARLFSATRVSAERVSPERGRQMTTYKREVQHYWCDALQGHLVTGSNVFSHQRLDVGTALLMESVAGLPPASTVLDLGCGNGVLGIHLARNCGATDVAFCDVSAQAIAAAKNNAREHLASAVSTRFHWGNGLAYYTGPPVERIVCNPPFHAGHTVDVRVGEQLLAQCGDFLVPGGDLVVVANRHLDYRAVLNSTLGRPQTIASDRRFVVNRVIRH